MENIEAIRYFFVWLVIWSGLYCLELLLPVPLANKYRKLPLNDELDVRNRFISLIHGIVALSLSGYEYFFLSASCSDANTFYESHLLLISTAYFTYDFLAMAYYGLLDWSMTLHHCVVVLGMGFNVYDGYSAHLLLGGMFVAEISNPPMHVRCMLKQLGLRYTRAYELADMIFLLLYMVARIVFGTYQVYIAVNCDRLHFTVKVCAVALLLQSYHFSIQMKSIVQKRFTDMEKRKKYNVKMNWFYPPLSKDVLEKLGLNKDEKTAPL
ncbi:tlcd5 [Symbiodinium microadriaticum]|nr:tlcd5 [Symbiodinium microadriaticum]